MQNLKSPYSSSRLGNEANRVKVGISLQLPKPAKKQIYMITNEFPVSKPYSTNQEW